MKKEKGLNPVGGRGNDKVRKEVLRMLKEGYSRDGICKALSVSISRFYFIRKKLRKLGFLDLTFWPKEKGLNDVKAESQKSQTITREEWRLHRVQVRFEVSRWLLDWGKLRGKWVVSGFGGRSRCCVVSVGNVRIKVYRRVLDVYLPEFRGVSVLECENCMRGFLINLIPILEDKLGVLLRVPDDVMSFGVKFIRKREFALEGALNSVRHMRMNERIFVRDVNGELRYVVDKSLGVPEFEAVHPRLSKGDAGLFEDFYRDVLEGKYELHKKGLVDIARASELVKKVLEDNTKSVAMVVKVLKDRGLLE